MSSVSNFTNVFFFSCAFIVVVMWNVESSSILAQAAQVDGDSAVGVTVNFRSDTTQDNHPLAKLQQQDPSGLLTQSAPLPTVDGNANYSSRQNRQGSATAVSWNQPNLRHRKLYFEDAAIERSNEPRKYSKVASGMHFFKSLFRFPLRKVSGR